MQTGRVRLEDIAFVLHKRAYKNTSLIVTLFTQQHGCLRAVAQGASRTHKSGATKKPLDVFRQYYCYLQTSGSLYKLLDYEQQPPSLRLIPKAMMLLQYCNEAVLRALPTELAVPHMFIQYQQLLTKLHSATTMNATILWHCNSLLDSVLSVLCHMHDWRELLPTHNSADGSAGKIEAYHHYQLYDAGLALAKTSQGALLGQHLLDAQTQGTDYQQQLVRCTALIHIHGCLRHTKNAQRIHTQSAQLALAALERL